MSDYLSMKNHILRAELLHPVKSFDEKSYICETCYKHLHTNEIPCQTVCNKIFLYPVLDELKNLKKIQKDLTPKRILYKKIVIMYGKGELSKIKGIACNIAT